MEEREVGLQMEPPVQAGFSIAPEYDSKGQLKAGVKLWMSYTTNDPQEAWDWLSNTLNAAVKVCNEKMQELQR